MSSFPPDLLVLRGVSLRIGFLSWSGDAHMIPYGVGRISVTWFLVGGARFRLGVGLCRQAMMIIVSLRLAG